LGEMSESADDSQNDEELMTKTSDPVQLEAKQGFQPVSELALDQASVVSSGDAQRRRDELLPELFEIFDADRSGTLNVNELATLLRAVGVVVSNEQLVTFIRAHSGHRGKAVSLDEFLQLIAGITAQGLAPERQLLASASRINAAAKKRKPLDSLRDDLQVVLESRGDVWFEELLADRGGQRQKLKEKYIFPKTCSVLVDVAEEVLFFEELRADLMRDLRRCRESLKQTNEVGRADLSAALEACEKATAERDELELALGRMQSRASDAARDVQDLRTESIAAREHASAQHASLDAKLEQATRQIAVDNETAQELVDEMRHKDQKINALQAYGPKCHRELELLQNEQQANVICKSLLLDTLDYYEAELPRKHDSLLSLMKQQKTLHKAVEGLLAARERFDGAPSRPPRKRN